MGYAPDAFARSNEQAIALLEAIRSDYETPTNPMVISGCIDPRGDGYSATSMMTVDEAEQYHGEQIRTFRESAADMVTAITMTYSEEAIGLTRAAQGAGMPVAISFTVETDGRLPSGQPLADAIGQVEDATNGAPVYYMLNCAHPTHFDTQLPADAAWTQRIRGLRANASTLSHAELDEATELDDGDPVALGEQYRALSSKLPNLNILGGCCGTDHRHVEEICKRWLGKGRLPQIRLSNFHVHSQKWIVFCRTGGFGEIVGQTQPR